MSRSSLWTIVLLVMLACTGAEKKNTGWEVTIRGKVVFPQSGSITLTEVRQDTISPVEAKIELKADSTFEKKIAIKEPGYYRLNFYQQQIINVVLDKSDLEVNVDGNDASGFYEVKGSPDFDLVMHVQEVLRSAESSPEAQSISNEFQSAARENNEQKILELQQRYMGLFDKAYDSLAIWIRQQPLSLGMINLLQNNGPLDQDKYFSVYTELADKFRKEWPENSYAKGFVEFVDGLKKTAIGQPAPEISLPDPDGKILKLSSFKGTFVLVDFWAKWCGPCRQENPNVVKAYHQFKDRGFDILGVSLDRSREDWVKAIQEDGLVWHHVSDLNYFNSQAAKDYNINGIPFSILVDPNGIIIAKNLRGSSLQKKLDEVLNKKR